MVRYIDRSLAGDYAGHQGTYDEGLEALDRCARERFELPFAGLEPADQDALLRDFELGAAGSGLEGEAAFFELVRKHVVEGMFGDPAWGGNDGMVGWKLLGYTGPKLVWTGEEQALDAMPRQSEASPAPDELLRTDA